jgi:uroporphyrin-III C-methyltransferase / precorrin-2 dehydrogenase / sirohydrochlorin ferrochelatase
MASFPIFVEVGRTAPLVVGGGHLALSKARLLLKRADRVGVIAAAMVEGFRPLIEDGRVERLTATSVEEALRGRPLVISATENDKEDTHVSAVARQRNIPINVPDRPHLSTFAIGAMVDRGTVTVAIGTEGAAPVLATRLRAAIEQELHPRLGRLADIARDYRDAVASAIAPGPGRRMFWHAIFGGAAAQAILAGDETAGRAAIEARLSHEAIQTMPAGRVILVGAGPGDPDLLTLKAVRALKSADVIVHDGLMGDGMLDHARREAQLISVAKAKGRHSKTQAEINALLVALAREGKTVVRLKGGDPSIFGRGGEEIEMLRASGIAVEVIPGITAATAAAASLQIPLTHRALSRSVTFISGHAAGDGAPEFDQVDLEALAHQGATLAVYMGLASCGALARRLIDAGWPSAMPVLVASRVSQPGERRIATTLDVLAEPSTTLDLTGPALLIVGEVAGFDAASAIERNAQPMAHSDRVEVAHA